MTDIQIEKGLPIPVSSRGRKYPYEYLDVSDSFFVTDGNMQQVCNMNYRYGKRFGRKFIARQEAAGVRVWRTE